MVNIQITEKYNKAMCYLHPVKHASVDVGRADYSGLDEVRVTLQDFKILKHLYVCVVKCHPRSGVEEF